MNINSKHKYFYLFLILIFCLGFILRFLLLIDGRSLWHDETSLGMSLVFKNFIELWQPLLHVQSAPPLFLTFSKLLFSISPQNPEYILRIIPFLFGIISIFLFYKLSLKVLKNKGSILFANLIFAINIPLIVYSSEFKQYSGDVAIVLTLFLLFDKYKIENITTKQKILLSIILLIVPFISLPSIFVIASYILLSLLKKKFKNIKEIFFIILPITIAFSAYYFHTLIPAKEQMLNSYSELWSGGFLNFHISSIINLLKINLNYFFYPCKFILIPCLFFFIGIFALMKKNNNISKLILLTLFFVILASFLHIYPIKERTVLYLIPLTILFIFIPTTLSFSRDKNRQIIYKTIIVSLILIFFSGYNVKNFNLLKNNHVLKKEYPKELMIFMKEHYTPGEVVIYNDASDSEFYFYSTIYNFSNSQMKIGKISLSSYGEDWYYNVLNILPKNQKYWFFYSYDYYKKPVIPFLKKWARQPHNKIIYEKERGISYLLLIEN